MVDSTRRSDPAAQPRGAAATQAVTATGTQPRPGVCEVCGNHYDKTLVIQSGTRSHVFDCFECAIHALAPVCAHCGCRILGHGMEGDGQMFCCSHCAESRGVDGMKDRA